MKINDYYIELPCSCGCAYVTPRDKPEAMCSHCQADPKRRVKAENKYFQRRDLNREQARAQDRERRRKHREYMKEWVASHREAVRAQERARHSGEEWNALRRAKYAAEKAVMG
jgi:hypothetical protein